MPAKISRASRPHAPPDRADPPLVHHFDTTRLTHHSADQMFALVADVEAYPEFVPLCSSMVVEDRRRDGARETITAKMTVAYSLLHETFTSRVVLDRDARTIEVTGIDGPFSSMDNIWRFEPVDDETCRVVFSIDYEFRSRTLSLLLGGVFDHAFRRFAAAFEARADKLYGA